MITPAYVQKMAAHNAEMNRRWHAAASRLTDAQRKQDRSAFFGSLHGTLCHILWADRLVAWAAAVTQDWLDSELVWFSGSVQRELTQKRDLLGVHWFNHQTHHRGQAHALPSALGQATGDTDLPFVKL
jgi:uncharacterized damage-inducible protein DinB